MPSIWSTRIKIPTRPPLSGDIAVSVAVIGGGMAGILTAHRLQEQGCDVLVVEADRIGSGQTRNTTAKITSQHDLIYAKLIDRLGEEKAGAYARANQNAIASYRRMVAALDIDCALKTRPAYLYTQRDPLLLGREVDAAAALGIPATFVEQTTLPFPALGAVRFEEQAQFQPLAFLQAVSRPLRIFERTKVTRMEGHHRIVTKNGVITAEHVVFCTHFPPVNFPGFYFLRMHQERSYVLALKGAALPDGMYLGTDPGGLSLRSSGDLLLLGGGGHRTGENSVGGQYDALRQQAKAFFPGSHEVAHWSAQDGMPLDGVPYIGQFSVGRPNWSVAVGFGKWGMTTSMVAAELISDRIAGRKNRNADLFSPQRSPSVAAARGLMVEVGQATKGIARTLFSLQKGALADLPCGHGAIVRHGGRKLGVYREGDGTLYAVSVRCPHLGCQLEWNPDEKSWDCPCHGSRFDIHGRLLDGPAQEDVAHRRLEVNL